MTRSAPAPRPVCPMVRPGCSLVATAFPDQLRDSAAGLAHRRAAGGALDLVDGGPAVHMPGRVWIDTDAACDRGRTADPDDCFAVALLLKAPELEVVGISTVHGNASLAETDRTTRALVAELGREGIETPPVYQGAAAPLDDRGPAPATAARDALREALSAGPLTIIALGPLTNIAAALEGRPDVQANGARLVAVMGRRPGHIFHPAEGRGTGGILFGHGPVFTDFNFAQDPEAAARVVAMRLPVSLIPYGAARAISLTAADLSRLRAARGVAGWAAERASGWLDTGSFGHI